MELLFLFLFIFLLFFVPGMARRRGRSTVGWFIFSLLLSPILAIIILALLGDTERRKMERIEYMSRMIRDDKPNAPTYVPPVTNPTGRTINDLYKR